MSHPTQSHARFPLGATVKLIDDHVDDGLAPTQESTAMGEWLLVARSCYHSIT